MLVLLVLLFHTVWLTGPAAVVRAHIALSSSATTQKPLGAQTTTGLSKKNEDRVFFYYHNNIIIAIYNCPAPAVIDNYRRHDGSTVCHVSSQQKKVCASALTCCMFFELKSAPRQEAPLTCFEKTRKLTHANLQNHMSLTNK